jgi:hypothetical protein
MERLNFYFRLLFYLVFFVVGIGGLGVWIPLYQMHMPKPTITLTNVIASIATLVISLSVTAYADFQLQSSERPAGKTRKIFFFALMLLSAGAGVCALILPDTILSLKIVYLGSGLAIFKWVLVNASNPAFSDDSNSIATLGGSIQ